MNFIEESLMEISSGKDNNHVTQSILNFVDLAGSEKASVHEKNFRSPSPYNGSRSNLSQGTINGLEFSNNQNAN